MQINEINGPKYILYQLFWIITQQSNVPETLQKVADYVGQVWLILSIALCLY